MRVSFLFRLFLFVLAWFGLALFGLVSVFGLALLGLVLLKYIFHANDLLRKKMYIHIYSFCRLRLFIIFSFSRLPTM